MSRLILDCSVTLSWCFEDEADRYSDRVLAALEVSEAVVPSSWALEVANAVMTAERRGHLTETEGVRFLALLQELPILVEDMGLDRATGSVLALARKWRLTSYDAAYMDLAMRLGAPLATKSRVLRRACRQSGVALFKSTDDER